MIIFKGVNGCWKEKRTISRWELCFDMDQPSRKLDVSGTSQFLPSGATTALSVSVSHCCFWRCCRCCHTTTAQGAPRTLWNSTPPILFCWTQPPGQRPTGTAARTRAEPEGMLLWSSGQMSFHICPKKWTIPGNELWSVWNGLNSAGVILVCIYLTIIIYDNSLIWLNSLDHQTVQELKALQQNEKSSSFSPLLPHPCPHPPF